MHKNIVFCYANCNVEVFVGLQVAILCFLSYGLKSYLCRII
jgi:hypothetical protein